MDLLPRQDTALSIYTFGGESQHTQVIGWYSFLCRLQQTGWCLLVQSRGEGFWAPNFSEADTQKNLWGFLRPADMCQMLRFRKDPFRSFHEIGSKNRNYATWQWPTTDATIRNEWYQRAESVGIKYVTLDGGGGVRNLWQFVTGERGSTFRDITQKSRKCWMILLSLRSTS